ncbi:hypothetical protein INR49_020113 [Caranx melampygus]|nr:hypothetical protein INR49_020113 [Caranx melampygus]
MHINTHELSYSLSSLEAVKCGLAPIPKYGMIVYLRRVEGSTTVYGDTVTYKCRPPYAVIGDETARCTETGTWTETPECQVVTCPPPEEIANGFMSNNDQREFEYMETIRYGCNQNYVLLGNLEIVCQRDGRWSEKPSCRGRTNITVILHDTF